MRRSGVRNIAALGALLVMGTVVHAQQEAAPTKTTPPSAQQAPSLAPTQADVDKLQAQIVILRAKLADAERRLGEETRRRAELDLLVLNQETATLTPAVRRQLGLPVSEPAQATPKD